MADSYCMLSTFLLNKLGPGEAGMYPPRFVTLSGLGLAPSAVCWLRRPRAIHMSNASTFRSLGHLPSWSPDRHCISQSGLSSRAKPQQLRFDAAADTIFIGRVVL